MNHESKVSKARSLPCDFPVSRLARGGLIGSSAATTLVNSYVFPDSNSLSLGICSSVFVAAAVAMWLGVKREDLIKLLMQQLQHKACQ